MPLSSQNNGLDMAKSGPGKAHREGISLMELADMFPDETTATAWFEAILWGDERCCPRCGGLNTREASATSGLPYYCSDCRRAFSVRIGTALERSKVSLRQWVFAIYLEMTSIKGISSMKLHRDIKVTQKTAWFMLHRIREAWMSESDGHFTGPVEVDEVYIGGKRKNMSNEKRRALKGTGRGSVGKTAVAGIKDRASNQVRAQVVQRTDAETLQGFIVENTDAFATVYTDDASAYQSLPFTHESVKHSVSEYVRDQAHTNGMESFWALLRRGYHGTFHQISPKHLQRYVAEFAGRHNIGDRNTIDQMREVVTRLVGRRLMYKDLVA